MTRRPSRINCDCVNQASCIQADRHKCDKLINEGHFTEETFFPFLQATGMVKNMPNVFIETSVCEVLILFSCRWSVGDEVCFREKRNWIDIVVCAAYYNNNVTLSRS